MKPQEDRRVPDIGGTYAASAGANEFALYLAAANISVALKFALDVYNGRTVQPPNLKY